MSQEDEGQREVIERRAPKPDWGIEKGVSVAPDQPDGQGTTCQGPSLVLVRLFLVPCNVSAMGRAPFCLYVQSCVSAVYVHLLCDASAWETRVVALGVPWGVFVLWLYCTHVKCVFWVPCARVLCYALCHCASGR